MQLMATVRANSYMCMKLKEEKKMGKTKWNYDEHWACYTYLNVNIMESGWMECKKFVYLYSRLVASLDSTVDRLPINKL